MCFIWSYSFRHFEIRLWCENKWNVEFFPLEKTLVTVGLNSLSDSISAIISPNTIKTLLFFVGLQSSKFSSTSSIVCEVINECLWVF